MNARPRQRALAGALVLVAATRAGAASAEGALTWRAPASCPDEALVLASVDRLHAPAKVSDLPAAVAEVRAVGEGFSLHLTLHARAGSTELTLTSRDCATLAEVVALQLALAADAGAVVASLPPQPPAAKDDRFGVSLAVGAVVGPLPGAVPGLRASASLDVPFARVEVTAKAFLPTAAYYATPSAVGARFTLITAGLRACSPLPRTGLGASTCLGFEAGGLGGAGVGALQPLESTQFWGAATVAPLVRYAFASGFVVAAEGDFGLAVTRPEFHARSLDTLFRADRTAAALWLGAGMHFD